MGVGNIGVINTGTGNIGIGLTGDLGIGDSGAGNLGVQLRRRQRRVLQHRDGAASGLFNSAANTGVGVAERRRTGLFNAGSFQHVVTPAQHGQLQ